MADSRTLVSNMILISALPPEVCDQVRHILPISQPQPLGLAGKGFLRPTKSLHRRIHNNHAAILFLHKE